MGPELAPTLGTTHAPGTRTPTRVPGGVCAVAVLAALPVVVFGIPALLGHPVLPGDDLTQNLPLRVLAGQQIRHGHLPLYNPYIWSGAPLLGGWNAGAAYPFTLLFAIAPATAAWTLSVIVTWAVAGLGMFAFLRALRLGALPGFLGALSFTFAGAMSAQVAHFGLVAGMSWVPLQLLSVLRLTETASTAARLRWTAVLAASFGLTILAGEPRAIDDAGVIAVIYAAWRIARLRHRRGPAAASTAGGLALGACLGAVQWLPGLAAFSTSQRAASSVALFNSGSLPHRWLLLMLVPDLMGGSGSFGQPAFFADYNLAEVTGYVGIVPLVAAIALLAQVRLRPRLPEWIVWHVTALAGLILALGGNSPAGSLLVHLPLFSGQRLQSRNILVTDLALAILLAYWAEHPRGQGSARLLRLPVGRRISLEAALGVLAPLAVIAVVVLGLAWGQGLLHWLRADPGEAGRLRPWLVPYALLGAGALALVIFGRRLQPRLRLRWLAGLVVADLVVFTVLAVVAVGRGLGGSSTAASQPHTPAPRPIAALGYPGRFAIYDPDQLHAQQLPVLGAPDLNAASGTPSVQGYSSTVDGRYASATGSHQAMGQGQDVLSPRSMADGTLDQLNTSVLLTPPGYLLTAARGSGPAPGPGGTGDRDIAAGQRATWYFAQSLNATRLAVPDVDARPDVAAGIRMGLVTLSGTTRWFPAHAAGAALTISLRRPVPSVAAVVKAGSRPSHLSPATVTGPGGTVFVADGQLQDALLPPRWGYAGHDGSFAVFTDHFARGPLSLMQAEPGQSASGASVRPVSGPAIAPEAADVSSPHGVRVVRSVAAIPGWSATWHPRAGPASELAVTGHGVVQAVTVPPGQGIVTWSYTPPGFTAGSAMSLAALGLVAGLVAGSWLRRRADRPSATEGERSDAAPLMLGR